jgi:hypothetical protein
VQSSFDFSSTAAADPGFVGFSFTFGGDEAALSALASATGLLSLDHDRRVQRASGRTTATSVSAEELFARAAARNASAALHGRSLARQHIGHDSFAGWPLDRIDQPYWELDGQYSYQQTGKNVRLYVLGGGMQLNHKEFTGRAVKGYDFVTPFGSADDTIECDPADSEYGYTTFVRLSFDALRAHSTHPRAVWFVLSLL